LLSFVAGLVSQATVRELLEGYSAVIC